MTNQIRRNLAVQIRPPGGDNPLRIEIVRPENIYSGVAVDTLKFIGHGGTPPYAFSVVTGTIPAGFPSLPADGDWSGETASQGHYSFVVQIADSDSVVRSQRFTIDVLPSIFLVRGHDIPVPGEYAVDTPYSFQFIAALADGTYITSGYSFESGSVPGLSLNTNGFLTGDPDLSAVGINYFELRVDTGSDFAIFPMTLRIYPEMTFHTVPESMEPRVYCGIPFENKALTTYALGGKFDSYIFQWDNLVDYPWLSFGRRVTRGRGTAGSRWVFSGTPPIENIGFRQVITGTVHDGVGGHGPVEFAFTPIYAMPSTTTTVIDVQSTNATVYHVEFDDFSSGTAQKHLHFPNTFQVLGVSALMDGSGDGVFDLWVVPFASYPPSSGDSICAGTPLTLVATDHAKEEALVDWAALIPADSTMIVDASAVTGFNFGTVTIWGMMGTPAPVSIQIFGASSLPNGETGTPYLATLNITGGFPPYVNLQFAPDLPDGITAAFVGVSAGGAEIEFSGTPTTAVAYVGQVSAEDGLGNLSNIFSFTMLIEGSALVPFPENNLLAHPEYWTDAGMNCPPLDWDGTGYLMPSDSDSRVYTLNSDVVITADHYIGWTMAPDDIFAPPDISMELHDSAETAACYWRPLMAYSATDNPTYGFVKGTDVGAECKLYINVVHHGYIKPYFPPVVASNILAVATNFEDASMNSPPLEWTGSAYVLTDSFIRGLATYSGTDFYAVRIFNSNAFGDDASFYFTDQDTTFNIFEARTANIPLYLWFKSAATSHVTFSSIVFSGADHSVEITPFTGGPT